MSYYKDLIEAGYIAPSLVNREGRTDKPTPRETFGPPKPSEQQLAQARARTQQRLARKQEIKNKLLYPGNRKLMQDYLQQRRQEAQTELRPNPKRTFTIAAADNETAQKYFPDLKSSKYWIQGPERSGLSLTPGSTMANLQNIRNASKEQRLKDYQTLTRDRKESGISNLAATKLAATKEELYHRSPWFKLDYDVDSSFTRQALKQVKDTVNQVGNSNTVDLDTAEEMMLDAIRRYVPSYEKWSDVPLTEDAVISLEQTMIENGIPGDYVGLLVDAKAASNVKSNKLAREHYFLSRAGHGLMQTGYAISALNDLKRDITTNTNQNTENYEELIALDQQQKLRDTALQSYENWSQANENAGKSLPEWKRFLGDLTEVGTSMAPQILTGGLESKVMPFATTFLTSAGQNARQAELEGATPRQAAAYGGLMGAVDAGTEKLFGISTPWMPGGLDKAVQRGIANRISNQAGQRLANYAVGSIGEGTEEGISALVQPWMQRLTYDTDAPIDYSEVPNSFLLGTAAGAMFGALPTAVGLVGDMQGRGQNRTGTQTGPNTAQRPNSPQILLDTNSQTPPGTNTQDTTQSRTQPITQTHTEPNRGDSSAANTAQTEQNTQTNRDFTRAKNTLVFRKVGDGYESYGDNAQTLAQRLGLTLENRPVMRDGQIMGYAKTVRVPQSELNHIAAVLDGYDAGAHEWNGESYVTFTPKANMEPPVDSRTTQGTNTQSAEEQVLQDIGNTNDSFDKITSGNDMETIKQEYTGAVDPNMVAFTEYAIANPRDNKTAIQLNDVSPRAASEIQELTGINVDGFGTEAKANTIRHIIERHGENGVADHSLADVNDIARMQYVIDNYDNMELLPTASLEFRDKNQRPAPMVKLTKRVNGNYYVVEAVPDTKKKTLEIVTAYKEAAHQTRDAQGPHSDVQNASDVTASTTSIPENSGNVNGELRNGETVTGVQENNTPGILTSEEEGAIIRYKGGGSYTLNDTIRNRKTLTESQSKQVQDLNRALERMPRVEGTVYRNIGFYNEGQFNKFIEENSGRTVTYPAFTSASKTPDGYIVETPYQVHMEVTSKNGRDLTGIGTEMEEEVLFKTDTTFQIHSAQRNGNVFYLILEEVAENGHSNRYDAGTVYGSMGSVKTDEFNGKRSGLFDTVGTVQGGRGQANGISKNTSTGSIRGNQQNITYHRDGSSEGTEDTLAGKTTDVYGNLNESKDKSDRWGQSDERWQARTNEGDGTNQEIKSLSEIVKFIEEKFGLPIGTGNISQRNARGVYKGKAETVRTRIANALPTISHEVGHHLDKRFGLSSSRSVQEVIDKLPAEMKEAYKPEEIPGEAVAEFIREYLTDPQKAVADYPNFHQDFINKVGSDTETAKIVVQLANMVHGYMSADPETRLNKAVGTQFQKDGIDIRDTAKNIYNSFTDDAKVAEEIDKFIEKRLGRKLTAEESFYVRVLNERGSSNTVKSLIEDKLVNPSGEVVGGSLQDALSGLKKKDVAAFNRYLVVKHAQSWLTPDENSNTKRVFADDTLNRLEFVQNQVQRMEQEHPEFIEAAQKIYEYQNTLMKTWLVDTGLMSQETYQRLRENTHTMCR